jgi:hypothetical protein
MIHLIIPRNVVRPRLVSLLLNSLKIKEEPLTTDDKPSVSLSLSL